MGQSVTFSDADGDELRATFWGAPGAKVDILDPAGSDPSGTDIGDIVFTNTDAYSQFRLIDVQPGDGDDEIEILGGVNADGIATAGNEGMGLISLGVTDEVDFAGETVFAQGTGVDIGGGLGALLTSGTLDFDNGQNFVSTGGDLGLILAGTYVLDSSTNQADITAGASGAGDISFLLAEDDILTSTGGSSLAPDIVSPGSPLIVNDDVGVGTTGRLRISASGVGSMAEVYSVPVAGGGSVVSEVISSGTVSIASLGAGGDIGIAEAEGTGTHNITIRGARDTDLLNGGGEDGADLVNLRNLTVGGDIYWVEADNAIGTLQARGNIGAVSTGQNNSYDVFPQTKYFDGNGVWAGGDIGTIRAGGIVNLNIHTPGNIGTIDAGVGGVMDTRIQAGGDLDVLRAGYIYDSEVMVEGSGNLIQIGAQGVHGTELEYWSGVDRALFLGDMVGSELSSLMNSGSPGVTGGRIGYVRATSLSDSYLEALDGFGTVIVTETVTDSRIDTLASDGSVNVGGGIDVLQLGTVADDSEVEVFGDITRMVTGTWSGYSDLDLQGNLQRGVVRGDLLDSALDIDGNVGSLTVLGDLLDDGSRIYVGGSSDSINVMGSLVVGGGIEVNGDSRSIVVRGGGSEGSDIEIGGNSGFLSVGFLADSTDIEIDGNSGTLIVGSMDYDSDIDIGGSSGSFRILGSAYDSDVNIGGNSNRFVAGSMYYGDVEIDGNSNVLLVTGPAVYTDFEVDGDADQIQVGMLREGSEFWVSGDLGRLVAGGATHMGYIEVGGSADFISIPAAGGGIDGDSSTLSVGDEDGGDLGTLLLGPITEFYVNVYSDSTGAMGNVTGGITVRGSVSDLDVGAEGRIQAISILGHCDDGDFGADRGFGNILIGGSLTDSDIDSRDWDGATGDPIGGGVERLQAASMSDVEIELHDSLDIVSVRGAMSDVEIDLRGINNSTSNLVGGGGIGRLTARGLFDTEIEAFGRIGRVVLGNGGVGMDSSIEVFDPSVENLGTLSTRGLIFGHIRTEGDVGSIFSGGRLAAVPLGALQSPVDGSSLVDRLFVDADGMPTRGTLAVDGTINGIIS